MINRFMFFVIIITQVGALGGTIVRTWIAYDSDELESLLSLESQLA